LVASIAIPMTLAYMTTPLIGVVDTAVVGQLGRAELLGGLAIGAILFDLLFTTFNFLRASTTGLTAQAYGRGDTAEQDAIFWRSFLLAVFIGLAIIALGPLLLAGGLAFMDAGPAVSQAASAYVAIRLFSAPAALANYSILGYILGRGQAATGLALQILISLTNLGLSILLGLTLGWGIAGVAWATVIAECLGAAAGLAVILLRIPRTTFPIRARLLDRAALKRLFALNGDIMIRSLALMSAFAFFTRSGVPFGPVTLAANAVLLNFFFVSAYFLDGLATAAEQIAGRAIGAQNRTAFNTAVRLTLIWSFGIAALAAAVVWLAGPAVIDLITTEPNVRADARAYLGWAAVTALAGVLAFQMDGVYIGATWSRDMRNMMLLSLAVFLAIVFFIVPHAGNHALWAALNIFLGLRGVSLWLRLPARVKDAFG
jgi:MATE family multidrug resistance protein